MENVGEVTGNYNQLLAVAQDEDNCISRLQAGTLSLKSLSSSPMIMIIIDVLWNVFFLQLF